MASEKLYGGSAMNVLLQNESLSCSSAVLESLWCPSSSSAFHGSKSMVNLEGLGGENAGRSYFQSLDKEENGDEGYDGCFQQTGKKRRLTAEQVQFLEKSFDVENKLEPDRKVQLARELGLQPRQVAIWFQNRRARFKTKQLEKDYDRLKSNYDKLKRDYETLLKEKEKLKNEVVSLKEKLVTRESGKDENLEPRDGTRCSGGDGGNPNLCSGSGNVRKATAMVCKQEEASSAKSDVFDSDSPHYTDADGNHSCLLEPTDSSNVFEPEQSDFSQDDDDSLRKSLLPSSLFPKLEDGSCNFGFPVEDQLFSFWA